MSLLFSRNILRSIKKNIRIFFIALIAFIFFFILFERLVETERESMHGKDAMQASSFANSLKIQVDRELNSLLFLSNGVAGYLNAYSDELDSTKVNSVLARLHKNAKHIRNFGIAIGYQMKFVYPLGSNEKALKIDYRNLPTQLPNFQKAIDTKQAVLEGPIHFVQGGTGFIYRYPIFVDKQYWAMVSTVIDRDSFLNAALNEQLNESFVFAARFISGKGEEKRMLFGQSSLFDEPGVFITKSDVPNGEWEWAVLEKNQTDKKLISILRLIGWLISFTVAAVLFFLLKDREMLTKKATRDSLTGLVNRDFLNEKLAQSLSESSQNKRTIAVMFIDIDHFKKVNDTYGHNAGDQVLKIVAKKILNTIRVNDVVCRAGGDEFIILLNNLKAVTDSLTVAQKIASTFSSPLLVDDYSISINLSIGIATPSSVEEIPTSLLKKADIALYKAKESGRNQYVMYQENSL